MPILNPTAPIRTACIAAITTATGLSGWAKKVPKGAVVPKQYFITSTQTKERTGIAKGCFDWQASIVIDLFNVSPAEYANPLKNDQAEELIVQAIEALVIPGWIIKELNFVQSTDLSIDTPTQALDRRVITYQFVLWQA